MNKIEIDEILTHLDYYISFRDHFLNKSYNEIDYGKRLGKIKFDSFYEAFEKYTYSNHVEDSKFHNWNTTLNKMNATEEDILVTCLEIFDWGNVLNGNVKTALDLYKKRELKSYIDWVKKFLFKYETVDKSNATSSSFDIIWSSGWTKVYSFINNELLIYDSRVSAFLNHTLIVDYMNFDNHKVKEFNKLTKPLYNFNGAIGRKRQVEKSIGFKNQHPSGIGGFNANLISSWIVQLLNERLNLNLTVRSFERAFFMLGFDLKQLE